MRMSDEEYIEKLGGPAYPYDKGDKIFRGMSLRDWFAGQALSGLVAAIGPGYSPNQLVHAEGMADDAYSLADAMLARRAA